MAFSTRLPVGDLDLRDLVWCGMLLALAAAVVVAFLGPAVDHHYAERQHGHSHLFLTDTAAGAGHPKLHPFERPHSHNESTTQQTLQDEIFYQPSNDARGELGTTFVAAGINDGLTHPIHRLDTASFTVIADDGAYNEAYVAPPTRPPRA
ncbi:MAG: hypothetical protein FI715_06510 [SAR202 cluster bacterium]|nr:hypothetical protein [Dehalococcoidia bacterium]MCL0053847.1 hypothetical protein [Dehalococcoidia bacterium]MQG14026.1 hypothetical protein [SAR202 cluster bacterium]MQG64789.1 hypothetical protein [SAR202 cluster bacterium]